MGGTGQQNAITPTRDWPWTVAWGIGLVATLILGWVGIAWFAGPLLAVGALIVGPLIAGLFLPRNPLDIYYQDRLIRAFSGRVEGYRKKGDVLAVELGESLLGQMKALRGDDAPSQLPTDFRSSALAALAAIQKGDRVNGYGYLAGTYLRAAESIGYGEDYELFMGCAAAALTKWLDLPKRETIGFEIKNNPKMTGWGESWHDFVQSVGADLTGTFDLDATEPIEAIRVVGARYETQAFDATFVRQRVPSQL